MPPDKRQPPSASGFKVADVYYTLFRHKWKIILCTLMGFGAAAVLYFLRTPPFYSEARLLVRYVIETKGFASEGPESQMLTPDARGANVINSEIELLTSLDLADRVAAAVGPEKILAPYTGGNNRADAAFLIRENLTVVNPRASSVIRVLFAHKEPQVAQEVLKSLVETYLKRHFEIHRAVGALDEFLNTETSRITAQLNRTEEDLRKAKAKAGVVSIEETKQAYLVQITQRQNELYSAEASLAELEAMVTSFGGTVSTNDTAVPAPVLPEPPNDVLEQYKDLSLRLAGLRQRLRELAANFTDANLLVKSVRSQITGLEEQQKRLETEYPRLAVISPVTTPGTANTPTFDGQAADARVSSLQAKVRTLKEQIEKLQADVGKVYEMETEITELQRKKERQEKELEAYASSLEQARLDSLLGNTKLDNIGVAQAPTPGIQDWSKVLRPVYAALFGGLALGLALAFLTEMFLDQTVKRVSDIENKLRLPVFLHIPRLRRAPKMLRQLPAPPNGDPTNPDDPEPAPNGNGNGNGHDTLAVATVTAEMPPWDDNHPMRPYVEALRDRFIAQFEMDENTRKPKLVALTGASPKAGTTTLAAGLAATLSETGDGNVLYVDMNLATGAAHPFHDGRPGSGIVAAFDGESGRPELVAEHLYMVRAAAPTGRLARAMPRRFGHLVPKMKASDYDYIIFDMPAVDQTTVTANLAGFMDYVMLVVEAEKSSLEATKRAQRLLQESKANVVTLLNKTRAWVPKRLDPEA